MKNKKLWGILGLIVVVALTVAAYFTPSANAESGSTTITVNVTNPKSPEMEIAKPAAGAEVAYKGGILLNLNHKETEEIQISAIYGDNSIIETPFAPVAETGTTDHMLDWGVLEGYYGPVTINVRAVAEGAEDLKRITINLVPSTAEVKDPAENDDPVIDVDPSSKVDKVIVTVADPDDPDNPLIEKEVPADELDEDITLPFEDEDLPEGDYKIIVTSYDEDGNPLGEPKVINYTYKKSAGPIVPDTGSFSEHLNVSSTDYLVVSLVAAGFAVIALAILIIKRSKR